MPTNIWNSSKSHFCNIPLAIWRKPVSLKTIFWNFLQATLHTSCVEGQCHWIWAVVYASIPHTGWHGLEIIFLRPRLSHVGKILWHAFQKKNLFHIWYIKFPSLLPYLTYLLLGWAFHLLCYLLIFLDMVCTFDWEGPICYSPPYEPAPLISIANGQGLDHCSLLFQKQLF